MSQQFQHLSKIQVQISFVTQNSGQWGKKVRYSQGTTAQGMYFIVKEKNGGRKEFDQSKT